MCVCVCVLWHSLLKREVVFVCTIIISYISICFCVLHAAAFTTVVVLLPQLTLRNTVVVLTPIAVIPNHIFACTSTVADY